MRIWSARNVEGLVRTGAGDRHSDGDFLVVMARLLGPDRVAERTAFTASRRHGRSTGRGTSRVRIALLPDPRPRGHGRGGCSPTTAAGSTDSGHARQRRGAPAGSCGNAGWSWRVLLRSRWWRRSPRRTCGPEARRELAGMPASMGGVVTSTSPGASAIWWSCTTGCFHAGDRDGGLQAAGRSGPARTLDPSWRPLRAAQTLADRARGLTGPTGPAWRAWTRPSPSASKRAWSGP